MPPSEQVLANDHGFRIQQTPDKVFFERPPATISPLLAWIPLGVGFLAFFVGIALFASSFSDPEARADLRTGTHRTAAQPGEGPWLTIPTSTSSIPNCARLL
jgi:hypothetical protein